MSLRVMMSEVRELSEAVRRCGCRGGLCATCLATLDRLDLKARQAEEAAQKMQEAHEVRSQLHATLRNARREGVRSENHRQALRHRGAANALGALLDGPTLPSDEVEPTSDDRTARAVLLLGEAVDMLKGAK